MRPHVRQFLSTPRAVPTASRCRGLRRRTRRVSRRDLLRSAKPLDDRLTPPEVRSYCLGYKMPQPSVFLSYSHHDDVVLEGLLPYLGTLEREGYATVWSDRRLQEGQDWRREIDAALEGASIAVLLISEAFLASQFIRDEELPRILRRQLDGRLTVMPVFVSPSTVNSAWIPVVDHTGQQRRLTLSAFQGFGTPESTLVELPLHEQQRRFVALHERIRVFSEPDAGTPLANYRSSPTLSTPHGAAPPSEVAGRSAAAPAAASRTGRVPAVDRRVMGVGLVALAVIVLLLVKVPILPCSLAGNCEYSLLGKSEAYCITEEQPTSYRSEPGDSCSSGALAMVIETPRLDVHSDGTATLRFVSRMGAGQFAPEGGGHPFVSLGVVHDTEDWIETRDNDRPRAFVNACGEAQQHSYTYSQERLAGARLTSAKAVRVSFTSAFGPTACVSASRDECSENWTAISGERRQGARVRVGSGFVDMTWIPSGSFCMGGPLDQRGSPSGSSAVPFRKITLAGFYIANSELTQRSWREVVVEDKGLADGGDEGLPMRATWHQARTFVHTLSCASGTLLRLPTEAEWEYAGRVADKLGFAGGGKNCPDPGKMPQGNVLKRAAYDGTLENMRGNMWEWCEDEWHFDLTALTSKGDWRVHGRTDLRPLRGGAHNSPGDSCNSYHRQGEPANSRANQVGFRFVMPGASLASNACP